MDEKNLYKQKFETQLDTWKTDLAMFTNTVSAATISAQIKFNKKIIKLYKKIQKAKDKFNKLFSGNNETWISIKEGAESTRNSLKVAYNKISTKFEN